MRQLSFFGIRQVGTLDLERFLQVPHSAIRALAIRCPAWMLACDRLSGRVSASSKVTPHLFFWRQVMSQALDKEKSALEGH